MDVVVWVNSYLLRVYAVFRLVLGEFATWRWQNLANDLALANLPTPAIEESIRAVFLVEI